MIGSYCLLLFLCSFLALTFCGLLYCNLRLRFISSSSNLEHLCITYGTCSRYSSSAVLHSYLLFIFHVSFCLTLDTISLCSHYFHNNNYILCIKFDAKLIINEHTLIH